MDKRTGQGRLIKASRVAQERNLVLRVPKRPILVCPMATLTIAVSYETSKWPRKLIA
jgi:hypothetical protein